MTSNVAHDEQKTVWIIGAGASSSHTGGHFPTLLGLPQAAARLGLLDDRRARLFQRRFLDDYLVERGFPSLASNRSLNLEAVLTALEIDIAVSPSAALYTAQDRLLTLLRETINAASVETTATLGEYDKLVQKLREEDSVITFNWDCLLDDAMGRKAMLQDIDKPGTFFPRIDPKRHYGRFLSAFTGWGESTMDSLGVPGPVRQWQGRSGYLIKAHGSVDWFYCENESCRGYQSAFPMHDQADLSMAIENATDDGG